MSVAGVGWPIPSSDAFRPINEVSDGMGPFFLSQELLPVWKSC